MSKNHPTDNIYSILGKLKALEPTPAEQVKAQAQMIRESVEARGSVLEGVNSIEKNLSEKYMGFKAVEKSAKKGGAENPAAVAASIGRKKYGKAAFQKAAAAGKKMGETLDGQTMGSAGVVGEDNVDLGNVTKDQLRDYVHHVVFDAVSEHGAGKISKKSDVYELANHLMTKVAAGLPLKNVKQETINILKNLGNEQVNEKAAPGQEGWIKKNKSRFIDQYGKKKGLEVLYATAWKRSKQDESAGVCAECGLTETECTCVHEGEITHTATGGIRHTKTDYPGYPTDDLEDPEDRQKGPESKAKGRPRKAQTKKPRVDPNAPKKGRGRPKAEKPPFSGKNAAGALTNILYGKGPKKHPAGRVHRMDEGRMLDETGDTLDHILTRYASEVKQFENNPNSDLDRDLYDALFDYYSAVGEMPYGVQKARTGDPYEWVCQQLEKELGMYEAIGTEGVEECGMGASSVAVAPTVDDLEEELNELARLAGLKIADEGNQFSGALAKAKASHQDTFDVDGQEFPVKEAEVAVDGDEGEAEEELANVPDEKYATIKHITTQGDDLNRQKKQDPRTANKAANPLTNDYMQLEARLAAEYESIKKVSK